MLDILNSLCYLLFLEDVMDKSEEVRNQLIETLEGAGRPLTYRELTKATRDRINVTGTVPYDSPLYSISVCGKIIKQLESEGLIRRPNQKTIVLRGPVGRNN